MGKQMASKSSRSFIFIFSHIICIVCLTGCNGFKPIPTPTSTYTPTKTLIPTSTYTVTPEPSRTATLIPLPTSSMNDKSSISLAKECRNVMDGLYKLKKDLGLPDHLTGENPTREDTDFDPNQYFQILSHLSLTPGYVLDYIYFGDELGGKPLLYARKTNAKPFLTYDDLLKSYGEELSGERSYSQLNHAFDYLEKIQIDKSLESYYQFIVLASLGDQFYLFWHGLYNDVKIMCDSSDLKLIYEDMKDFEIELPIDIANEMERIDFNPVVAEDKVTVSVRFVTFTKWGGFFENVYILDKEKMPLELVDVQWHPIIEYDCGIAF